MFASCRKLARTPLMNAVANGDEAEIIRLLAEGNDVNHVNKFGRQAIHFAAVKNNPNAVRMLAEARADLNAPSGWSGRRPMHYAAQYGSGAALRALLDYEADPLLAGARGSLSFISSYEDLRPADVTATTVNDFFFQSSSFKREYNKAQPAHLVPELVNAVKIVIVGFAFWTGISQQSANDFFIALTQDAVRAEEDVTAVAERLWTSGVQCQGFEWCHMLNDLLSADIASRYVAVCIRVLNTFCVTGPGRGLAVSPAQWPPSNMTYRSGGMPPEHRAFFHVGRQYRAPRVLPTSFVYDAQFAQRQQHEPIKWIFRFHPSRECRQVNYITRQAAGISDEEEFLFAPYSVFTVIEVNWTPSPSPQSPHIIVVDVPVDNLNESNYLPTAPWC